MTIQGKRIGFNSGEGHAVSLFPTICYFKSHQDVEEMNKELEVLILEREKKDAALENYSIKGGYHSDRKFLELDIPVVKQLRQLLVDDAMQYLKSYWKNESNTPLEKMKGFSFHIDGWSMVLREGDLSTPHTHPGANLSGVYYIKAAEVEKNSYGAGSLVLQDPRIRATASPIPGQPNTAMIPNKTGLVAMFPSYIEHYVLPFKGNDKRISVAFNITFITSG